MANEIVDSHVLVSEQAVLPFRERAETGTFKVQSFMHKKKLPSKTAEVANCTNSCVGSAFVGGGSACIGQKCSVFCLDLS